MSPFLGYPEGFSVATLELLDQGLNQIWHEMQIEAKAKTKTDQQASADRPSGNDACEQNAQCQPSRTRAIVK